jgi:hypothetical protein
MKRWIAVALIIVLAGCSSNSQQPLPTQAQLPTNAAATPTTENEAGTPEDTSADGIHVQFSGALEGTFTDALLSFETGGNYTLLLEQLAEANPVQLRLILAGNIEPGTYSIMPADDFALPAGAEVAARFDLGFLAEELTGTLVLDSIGENSFTGTLNLIGEAAEGTLTVTGRFQNLNAAVIG